MSKLIIKGGCVLSMDSGIGNQRGADILVEDGVITEVSTGIRARGADVIDASNAIVMPGFVDAHRHAAESLNRHTSEETELSGYSADDVYTATLIGLLSAAEAGITTVVDWCEITSADHAAAALQAHADAGLRTVYVSAGGGDEWRQGFRALGAGSPLTSLAAGPSAAGDWAVARELGLPIHVHAAGGAVPLELLGNDVTLAHGTGLRPDDFDAIAASGASLVLTPSSDMAEGNPPFPVQELIDRGIRPGLGTGARRIAAADLFAQIRAVISVQHAMYFELKLAGKAGLPRLLTTRDVLRYGTVDSARAAGLAEVAGRIAPGRPADVVVLGTDRPNIMPVNDPIGAVVWGMDTSNVEVVLVGGRPIVRDGQLTADADRFRALLDPTRTGRTAPPAEEAAA